MWPVLCLAIVVAAQLSPLSACDDLSIATGVVSLPPPPPPQVPWHLAWTISPGLSPYLSPPSTPVVTNWRRACPFSRVLTLWCALIPTCFFFPVLPPCRTGILSSSHLVMSVRPPPHLPVSGMLLSATQIGRATVDTWHALQPRPPLYEVYSSVAVVAAPQ